MTALNETNEADALPNASDIIERFGGIRPMATKMHVPVTTVQGWKKRNVIPGNRRDDVLRAAQVNNIDLSDLVRKGTANQNTTAAPASAPSFSGEVNRAARTETPAVAARHAAAVSAADQVMREQTPSADTMKIIKAAETRAVQKSALFSTILATLITGAAIVLLWPNQQKLDDHNLRIAALEEDASQQHTLFKGLMPEELGVKFNALEQQAAAIQSRVTEIAGLVTDPDAGSLGQRVARLEQHIAGLVQSPGIAAVITKIKTWQQGDGAQLQSAISDLTALVQGTNGQEAALDAALTQAQTENDALGQTLQGVSGADLKAAALLLGLTQFRTSMNRSGPIANDLTLLRNLIGDNDPELQDALTRLAPQADKGILTPAGLSTQLKSMAGDIVVASLQGEDVSMKDQAVARLNEVLQVSKDGELVSGTDTQAAIARAQILLDQGDVEGAVAVLDTLKGPEAAVAEPWIDQAQATMMAQKVQRLLTTKIAGAIKGGGGVPYTASGGGADSLVRELETLGTGGGGVITDPASGMSILPR